jgi:anti-sigma-K factor RskA
VITAMDSPYATPLPSTVAGKTSSGQTSPGRNGSAMSPRTRGQAQRPSAREPLKRHVDLPRERRFSAAALAGIAAAAGIAAIVLGGWAFVSGIRADAGSATVGTASGVQQALSLLARPDVERLRLRGSVGRLVLVVEPSGNAALVLNGLGPVDSEWAYQVWVTGPNAVGPRSAALFSGRETIVSLTGRVRRGAVVAVTLEPAAGSLAPTRTPKLVVERPV